MTAPVERYVEALRSSLKEVERLRQQNQELVAASGEPIAIVGMACRFPGDVATPEDLWRLVAEGRDAISAFPADRGWPDRIPGDTDADVTREGGFVRDIVEFDADFFGISPREALAMDPQQRVLLETAWEALERTGLDASALRGSRTGVFVGASGSGYTPPTELRGHLLTGQVISMISGRLAYTLGLQGPAVTVDTACSSSLVALHLAGQALRSDECSLALAAGVTVMATPAAFAEFGVQGGVAPDGRCKPFSDSADGTGWAEGCGVLVLERLSDARRNGHRILALVRGSAVNSDGASNGLTAPSGPAQRRVIRQALLSARLEAGDVDVVEAHGTGTTLGDPIEAQALLATYGQDRDRPLLLGSIKSNIGHTQAASGVAGVIKMVLAIRNGSVPRTLHVTEPSSHVDWSAGAVRLATEPVPWPAVDRPRRAAISSFGMSGTNAHVILEQTPPAEPTAERVRPESTDPMPWSLSARTEAALRDQAARLLSYLDREADQRPVDIGHTLATGRSLFEYRAVMVGKDDAELRDGLRALAADQPAPLLVTGSAANPRKVVFVFPGQGSQWVGMAAELKASSPVFAERLAECAAALSEYVDWDLDEVLGDEEALRRVDVVQPASWAVMVALAGLWRCHGVEPAAVVGHSQGEIAAACVAGALSLSEAALVVSLRSKAIAESLAGHGGMVSVALPVATVQRRLAELPEVSIAAVNGPASVVVSGPGATMDALVEAWAGEGVRARRVEVDYASHSAQVEVLRPRLMDLLAPIRPATATIPFHSTVTATPLDTKELTADYWYRNLRQTVQFGQTVSSLVESGCGLFIEISPHPVLLQGISQVIEQSNSGAAAIGTLRRDDGGLRRFLLSAAEAHVNGGTVDWTPALRGGRLADLPTAPFQRTRFWPESPEGVTTPDLRYRVTWKGLTVAGNSALDGPWLVAVPPGPVEDEWICAAIAELGETVRVEVGGTDRAQLADSLRVLAVDRTPFAGVLSFLAIQEEPASSVPESVTSTMLLAQALGDADIDAPLWCATRGAVAIDDTERVTDPAQVAVWGLGRVAAMEYPWRWGGLVDLPPTLDASTAARLADALGGTEDQIALRPGGVFGRRVSRAGSAGTRFSPRGTVLITGGTGALGGHTARWLARNGAERLLLVSRRGPAAPGADRLAAELAALGAQIDVIACDVADRQALTALLEHHRLTGVVHAAGVLDDGVLDGLTPERFESVFRAKVTPALLLDELTRDHDLSMFLLFSSMAGLVGAPGQASYAAANAHLDGLAEQRRGQGLPATAIAWGAWAGAGLAAQTRRADLARHGLALMDPAAAIATLPDVVDGPDAVALITDVDWDRYAPALAVDRPHPLLSDLPRVLERATTRPSGSQWRRSLSDLPATSRRAMVLDTVRAQAAAVLGHTDLAAIGPDRAFRDLGFDSLTAVELRNRLTATTGLSLPSSLVFDHPSPAVLVDFLLAELAELTGEQTGTANPAPIATVNTDDPIVIVGMACRYPAGIASPQDLWQLVAAGTDAISGFPTDRGWPTDSLDGTTVREGGFLLDAAEFDADFFGISPREALAMDPQQRLLLETSWEALEQAGIAPTGLKGSRGGVFIGAGQVGYGALLEHSVEDLRGHLLTGSSSSAMSGRISYTLGLEGPAVTVDTACSSSLVALHLAAQALRSGECDLALAGGVTVIPTPNVFEEFSRQGGLAVDGRCKSFSDAADGTGWSEGVGVVVVERLSDACRNGHQVLAVVRGSAVNQDGASNGLTAPNGPSQQRVIRQALAQAGLSTGDVDVVEAHGTGTRLGDPIEAQALLATYGRDRAEDRPLLLGSIKSNIGHTQAAAGVAGIIKMVLAMRNGVIPATLHVDSPSSQVDWTAGAVQLATEAVDWPETGRARRAGVSSFGISGTNAHIILEQAPATEAADNAQLDGVVPWVVSARTAEALDSQLDQLRSFTEAAPDLSSRDVGFSLATGRSVFEHRAVLLADANGAREIARGTAATQGVVFVFSGQGSQWVGMGRELYARCPVFAEAFDEVCVHLEVFLDEEGVESTGRAQPALFAIEVALFRLLLSWGVRPDYLIGHSVGEIAAAHVAGVFSLVDACRLVSARADLMQALPEGGVMVAARATEAEVRPLLSGNVCLAAVNGPHALVLSGPEDEVHAVTATLDEQGHKVTPLRVSHAFHSTLMRPMLAEFQAVAETLSFAPPSLSLVSTVTGTPIDDSRWCSPQYWVDQVEHTVRFADALRWVGTQGPHAVIEIGPGGGLAAAAAQTLGDEVVAVPSLRPQHDEQTAVITAVARLHAHGVFVDWPALFTEARPVTLPTYAFQRRRYWPRLGARPGDPGGLGLLALRHPLLGAGVELPGSGGFLCTGRLSLAACPWLADHRVMGSVVFPGAGFLELVVHVADQVACNQISELTLHTPLVLLEEAGADIQVVVDGPNDAGERDVRVFARVQPSDPWVCHASGVVSPAPAELPEVDTPLGANTAAVDITDFYAHTEAAGFGYGPMFQGLKSVRRTDDEVVAEVALPAGDHTGFALHPALLDAALHTVWFAGLDQADRGRLPFSWRGVRVYASGATSARVRLRRTGVDSVSLVLVDVCGELVASVDSLVLREVPAGSLVGGVPAVPVDSLFELRWVPLPAVPVGESVDAAMLVVRGDGVGGGVPGVVRRVVGEVLGRVREQLSRDVPLVVVTCGAVGLGSGVVDVVGSAVWGLVRSAQAEFPGRFVLVDTDDVEGVGGVVGAVVGCGESQVVVRGGVVHGGRLVVVPMPSVSVPDLGDGWVLVAGGGGLAGVIVRHLVAVRALRRVVLASRRGADPEVVAELVAGGVEVVSVGCDVADAVAVGRIFGEFRVTAVIHTAGVVDDAVVGSLTPERLDAVLRPKVDGAWNLHEASLGHDLAAFVVFSSIAGVMGGAGQANYAAGNAFVDGLVSFRRGLGLPGVSLAWGPWEQGVGMTSGLRARDVARMVRAGFPPLTSAQGAALFDVAVGADLPLVIPMRINRQTLASQPLPPLFRDLLSTRRQAASGVDGNALVARMLGLPVAERGGFVLEVVRTEVAVVLGHADGAVVVGGRAFTDMGFDSLTAVDLRNRLATVTGVRLPATLVFDYPTPIALAEFLLAELVGSTDLVPAAKPSSVVGVDPVVVVGMSCRFPGGVVSPGGLWDLVAAGGEGIGGFPSDRGWDVGSLMGPEYERVGGFLYDAAGFDAEFFGISPREAVAMDPQQRLLLEASWEAVEGAGIDPMSLRGSRTGVFAGVMYHDYLTGNVSVPDGVADYVGNGNAGSVASGRVSYVLGLEGPAVTIDTACSSSLVALHLAVQALRSGECDLALAGGVTVMSTPTTFVGFSRQGALAADGRCKSFADAADGTGWSEGVGILVVERLSDARRNGHRVLAVVKGSAVNQDGASNGLTAPNGPSQQRVIRQALAQAGLSTGDVDVVEAHGTGTRLGDPIEAQALLATYGRDRGEDRPLLLGSIKSNIGHTQAAAGVAGIIKMVMAMRHGLIPPTLHVDAPSSQVDWTAGAVRLATESTAWPETGRARRAGVSSFGISGTNAHIILEQPEVVEIVDAEPAPGVVPWVVAARSDTALTEQLDRVRSAARTVAPADIGFSLASGRSVFDHRAVLLSGKEIARGVAVDRGVVFVFSGQGSQRVGMGRELYARYPVFAEAFDEVCAHLEVSLDEECVENTGRAQPALFAIEVALFRLLSSWGVRPDYLIGHSVGEIAAAYVAGVLSLGDACRLMAARARLMQTLPEGGVMVAVRATEAEVASLLSAEVSLAAVNGPDSVVLSGPEDAVRAAAVALEAEGRKVTELRVSHAFHSTLMRPMLREFRETVTALSFSPPEIPIVSTVTGTPIDEDRWCSPEYWVEQVERTVRFADALSWAGEHGVSAVLEVGPGGGLAAVAPEILGGDTISTALLRADRDEQATVLTAIAHLHVHGVPVDWTTLYPGARKVDVPTYPFQHKHFWPNPGRASTGDAAGFGLAPVDHPLLSAGVELPGSGGFLCTGRISLSSAPWLADHVVMGSVLFPGTGFLELVACAAGQVGCGRIDELTVHVPLVLPEHDGVDIQVVVESPEKSAAREVRVFARVERSEPWVCRASGAVSTAEGTAVEGDMLIPHDAIPVDITDFHAHAAEAGFDYGPAFQGLVAVRSVGETVFAEVALPVEEHAVAARFALHPALLDVALHAIWFTEGDQASRGLLPFSWQGVRVHTTGATAARVRLRRTASDTLSLLLTDDRGTPIASVDSLTLRELPAGALDDNATAVVANSLFTVQWTKVSTKDVPAPDGVVVRTARGEDTDAAEATHGLVKVLLDRMRTWLAEPGQDQRPMVIVTSGAVDTVTDIAASAVWGLVRSAQAEHPDRFVLVDTDDIDGLPARLGAVLATGEPQILIRDGALHKARLTALPAPLPAIPDLGEGWVLVTGGGGGLAGVIVRHLVDDKAVRRVLLVGRRRPEAETVAELVAHGVEAVAVACDVADREAVRRLFDEFPITGVMHTAGVLDDAVITSLTPQRLDSVLRPKVDGAWNLHEASAGRDLAAFVVFSSAAGVVGSAGQGNYAAGNAFLDGLIAHRRANGLPGVSLAWGAWDQSAGMTAGLRARDLARLARTGFPPLTAVQGTALFDAALAADQPLVLPVRVARRVLATQPGPLPALLRDLAPSRTAQRPSGTVDLATIAPAEREGRLLEVVRTEVAAVLGHPDSTAITPDRPFSDLGFDSLTAVELRNRLAGVTGVRLAATLVFDHPTPAALAASLGSGITEEPTASPDAQDLVTRLYRQALADGKTTEADQLLMSLARLRPVVHDSAGLDRALKPTRLAAGGDGTRLVCLGPIVPLTGDRVYHRLASAFQGDRDVSALTPLGFTPGDPLPADARALVAVLADAVAGHVDAAPFALLGLSSGGLLAFEVAKALTARGLRPEAAVLIDTYAIDDPRLGEFQQEMAQAMYGRGDAAAPEAINQTSLSAHVWTCALFEDWRPEPAPFPTLLVRASEPLTAGRTDFGWQTSLDHITTTVDVPGNHFTMADEHIGSTAETINAWLADREQHQ